MDYQEAMAYIKNHPEVILEKASRKGYICPCCGSGSGKNGTGLASFKDKPWLFTCFANNCFPPASNIFGIVAAKEHLDHNAAFKRTLALYGITLSQQNRKDFNTYFGKSAHKLTPVRTEKIEFVDEKLNNTIERDISFAREHLRDTNYLTQRGISVATQQVFDCGFIRDWIHPKLREKQTFYPSPRIIIPTGKHSYLARDVRDKNTLSEGQQEYAKVKAGSNHQFNWRVILDEPNVICVTEGEIDAMSVYELGHADVLALGSVAYTKKLFDYIDENVPAPSNLSFVTVLDNDKSGDKASELFREECQKRNIDVIDARSSLLPDTKDANESLMQDAELFSQRLMEQINLFRQMRTHDKENRLSHIDTQLLGKINNLSRDGQQAFYHIYHSLLQNNEAVIKSAALSALLFAQHAEIYAEKMRNNLGMSDYNAITYLKERLILDNDGKYMERLNPEHILYQDDWHGSAHFFDKFDLGATVTDPYQQTQKDGELLNGAFSKLESGKRVISLFENADETTFVHEMSHLFLDDLMEMSSCDKEAKEDFDTVLDWAEWHEGAAKEYVGTPWEKEFRGYEAAIIRAEKNNELIVAQNLKKRWVQERFARGFERYLQKGVAPSSKLDKVFQKFKGFMNSVYKSFKTIGGEPTPQVENVMRKMITSEQSRKTEYTREPKTVWAR